ncbi:MAG: DUF6379 domain-containing protein [Eubacteriales bacterium]|nr:DUF6379 domain-containing protein [Eubacteriales bacterium]
MFDNNVFLENSCKNIEADGSITGFELQTNITYYRGIPLSMLEYVHVVLDDEAIPDESLQVSLDRTDWFTLKEAETVTTYKWEYGDPLYIRVNYAGGLSKGTHKIKLTVAVRTAYIPIPLEGTKERIVEIA